MQRKVRGFFGLLLIACTFLMSVQQAIVAKAALSTYEVDYDVYSLWVDEVPDGIYDSGYIAAKLDKTSLDPDVYILSMLDDAISMNIVANALTANGISSSKYKSFGMDVTLYKYNEEEGDYYASSDSGVSVVVPMPDDFLTYDDYGDPVMDTSSFQVVSVSASGKLSNVDFKLVLVDDIICAMFDITSYVTYGFYVKSDSVASTPTTKPTSTPTPKPTNTPTPKPTGAAATTAPTSTAVNNDAATALDGEKDTSPKTGDDHNGTALLIAGGISVIILGVYVFQSKK